MGAIRVLIIDDSVVVRRFVSDVLAAEPAIEVAGIAPNGRIGLSKIAQCSPDLVILDLEMPEMDGLATLVEIRRTWPKLPVIMYSSQTRRGAIATLDALEAGANDYVTKPSQTGSVEESLQRIRAQLVPKILALVSRRPPGGADGWTRGGAGGDGAFRTPAAGVPGATPIRIVAIGASTGGPRALSTIFAGLSAGFPVPIVVVQHMPPIFTAMLADRLSSRSAIRVKEAESGDRLAPRCGWIAPGDHHMVVSRSDGPAQIQIHRGPPENYCRPSVDVLFRSVAEAYGAGVLGVILTGMGNDGLRGCERIRELGGTILAQDEASSVVWGMPGFVARAGLADRVLPLEEIGPALVARTRPNQTVGKAV